MEFSLQKEPSGHVICSIADTGQSTTATAADANQAVGQLIAALEEARDSGYGECLWQEATGDYRWIFRRSDDRLTVVVLWSRGTATGWQHVFRSDCDAETLEQDVRREWRQVS